MTEHATMVWRLAEQSNVIHEEHPSYTFVDFLSDLGGTVGLFLGLNLIAVVQTSINLVSKCDVLEGLRFFKESCFNAFRYRLYRIT